MAVRKALIEGRVSRERGRANRAFGPSKASEEGDEMQSQQGVGNRCTEIHGYD